MTTAGGLSLAGPAVAATSTVPLRAVIFVAVFVLAWVSLKPFGDLAAADALDLTSGNEAATYTSFALLALLCGALVGTSDRAALRALATPPVIALGAWLCICVATSEDVVTSGKRFVLLACVATVCASLFLLPRGRLHMARLLSIACFVLLIVSYGGVIFVPHLAVHQLADLGEPSLAGSWRGVFPHKNDASAVFSMLVFIGLYVARAGYRNEGASIALLSMIFVLFSGGKSSTTICAVTIALSLALHRTESSLMWTLLIGTPFLLLNLFGLGSIAFPGIGQIAASLPLDTTFTGRIDVWRFALAHLPDHLTFGHGFAAFWNTESLRFGVEDTTVWAGNASHAHNGYLDAVLATGLAGLALTFAVFVVAPARDLWRALRRGTDPALTMMAMQIWLFGIYLSSLESFFFDRANPIWITFLFAIFIIRYIATFKVSGR